MSASTSHIAFFASAAASFHPTPYAPTASANSSSARPPTRSHRSHDSLAVPPLSMDPQPADPNVLFLHPPFTTFPGSDKHQDGLTYALMAENPEWFLDANDFISQPGTDTSGVPYPPHLEPPRGWCPAKKKDLKDRGAEGWPEGEEPRLRCTFCRRTYAGVNAKSMWRRHVFEKHKIAMANRRDGNLDRPRGRGSGKENRQQTTQRNRDDSRSHDSIISIVVAPQTAPEMTSHKSRFRTANPLSEVTKRRREPEIKKDGDSQFRPRTSQSIHQDTTGNDEDESDNDHPRPKTPPISHIEVKPQTPDILDNNTEELLNRTLLLHPIVPESPYNPLQTPSFRHSPPRLPSDQPWRFPSPSTRNVFLTMLPGALSSPLAKGSSSAPNLIPMNSSPFSSPAMVLSDASRLGTPARPSSFSKTFRKLAFLTAQSSSPLSSSSGDTNAKYRAQDSPVKAHRKQISEISENWFTNSASSPSSNDPFSMYGTWLHMDNEAQVSPVRLSKTPLEPESPVLRSSGSAPSTISFGLSLLEPFKYPSDEPLTPVDDDLQDILLSPPPKDAQSEAKRRASTLVSTEPHPPLKKRRMSAND